MKKTFFLLLGLLAFLQSGYAQNTIESIRQRYTDAKNYIASHTGQDEYDGAEWPEYYHVEARQFLPGTGGHKKDVYMYWAEREEEKIYASHYLTFASARYNYAASPYYEEYLYDDDGQLAFVYAIDPMVALEEMAPLQEYEFRFYLSKGKLLRAIIKRRASSEQPFTEVYTGTVLSEPFEAFLQRYLGAAKKIHQLFIDIEKEAYDYDE
ncbi:MAG: hypothetical protein K5683_04790 [Prevotella sp.]|nr:hypothetical protein [Prevotella sp.]